MKLILGLKVMQCCQDDLEQRWETPDLKGHLPALEVWSCPCSKRFASAPTLPYEINR